VRLQGLEAMSAKHTPGPLTLQIRPKDAFGTQVFRLDGSVLHVATWKRANSRPADRENARLLAAAYTSYDRMCGDNAVEAAESDLLSGALYAIKHVLDALDEGEDINTDMLQSIVKDTKVWR
jgi:hypothetical protein